MLDYWYAEDTDMNRQGFTLMELMVVIVLIGAMAALAFPRIGDAVTQQSVRSARAGIVTLVAKARGTAISRGSTTRLVIANNLLYVEAANPVTGAVQRVGLTEDFDSRYKVTIQPANDTLVYDGRGIAVEAGQTTYTVSRGTFAAKIVVSAVGRVIQ